MISRLTTRTLNIMLASTLGLGCSLALAPTAKASGFNLKEGSADALGTAFTGDEAKGYDASTVWSNPAGMSMLDSNTLEGGVSMISPSSQFSGSATNPLTGQNVSGVQGGNAIATAATAASYGVFTLGPNWRMGFSLTAPYGERTSYPSDWVGRYQSLVSSVTDFNLGLALSYKVNDHLSIGGGPNFDYFAARLTQNINVPGLSALTGQNPVADVHGNSLGVGYNIGIMYQFDPATRVGIDYRSRIRHDIFGIQKVTVPSSYSLYSPAIVSLLNQSNSSATTSFTLPDSISAGIYHQINARWAVMGSVQWTEWSLLKSVNITPTNGSANTVIAENWRNAWFMGAGTNYKILDNVMLQGGFSYDESPVTDSNRTTRVPDAPHYVVGGGVQYQFIPSATVQLAYAHVFSPGGNIHNTANSSALTPSGTIDGSSTASDNSVTLGMQLTF